MSVLLRYRCQAGQTWSESHTLTQVTQPHGESPSGFEQNWRMTYEVAERQGDRQRICWTRSADGEEPQQGEMWIDELGQVLLEGHWTAPLLPEAAVRLDEIWTIDPSPLGVAMHFRLETLTEQNATLVSYAEKEQAKGKFDVRSSMLLCRETGRVRSSSTVTRTEQPHQVVSSVTEVRAEGF